LTGFSERKINIVKRVKISLRGQEQRPVFTKMFLYIKTKKHRFLRRPIKFFENSFSRPREARAGRNCVSSFAQNKFELI